MEYVKTQKLKERLELFCDYVSLQCEYGNGQEAGAVYERARGALEELLEEIQRVKPDNTLLAREPDGLAEIRALRPNGPRRLPNALTQQEMYDRMEGAILGRFSACLLGVPVEGWSIQRMQALARQFGDAFPPVDYWSNVYDPELKQYHTNERALYTAEKMDRVCVDDDINYALTALLILERYGFGFTTEDVGEFWREHLDIAFTAELAALNNLKAGVPPMKAAVPDNPYVQWIGADIRSDGWAWVCAGNPEQAAELAWRDAMLTHRRGGIYGEMYFAAVQAAAFVTPTVRQALEVGLTEIPAQCTLAEDICWALEHAEQATDYRSARALVDEHFPGMSPVHTNNNACLTIFGLLLGGDDFTKTIGEVVAMGMDNDCTAATAGSILGAHLGAKNIPAHWTNRFHNRVDTYIKGVPQMDLDDVIERFLRLYKQNPLG